MFSKSEPVAPQSSNGQPLRRKGSACYASWARFQPGIKNDRDARCFEAGMPAVPLASDSADMCVRAVATGVLVLNPTAYSVPLASGSADMCLEAVATAVSKRGCPLCRHARMITTDE